MHPWPARHPFRIQADWVKSRILGPVAWVAAPIDFVPRRDEVCVFQNAESQLARQGEETTLDLGLGAGFLRLRQCYCAWEARWERWLGNALGALYPA